MKSLYKLIVESPAFVALRRFLDLPDGTPPAVLQNAAGSLLGYIAADIFARRHVQILLLAADAERAETLRDDCALLLGEQNVRFLGARSLHEGQSLDVSASIAQVETLKALAMDENVLVVASPQSIAERVPPRATFRERVVSIRRSADYNFQQLVSRLDALGFERKDFVGSYGEYAVRGGILDVYPFVGENPLRLEFWGDSVESIREFDSISQRSIRELESATIVPGIEPATEGSTEQPSASVFDYLAKDCVVIIDSPAVVESEIVELHREGNDELMDAESIFRRARAFRLLLNAPMSSEASGLNRFGEIAAIDFAASPQPAMNGSVLVLMDTIRMLTGKGIAVHLLCDTGPEATRLRELLEESLTAPAPPKRHDDKSGGEHAALVDAGDAGIPAPPYTITVGSIHRGFIYPSASLALFSEHEIFGRLKRRGLPKRRRFRGISQKEMQQLKRGDFVVHVDHGIGTFAGLTKLAVGGVEQEVMKLVFLENDVLYVNLNFLGRVQKYTSAEGHVPKIHRLGSGEWERATARAKRRIKDVARDIIALYARRKLERGFGFSSDTHWQKELEASFMYEDTPDQSRATAEVKEDMENQSPMDRLVCGDVGFGKTEVAVRAAFKAVMDGKQVAVLVPTTILAIQHYNTFQDRLERYTTKVEHLTRFRSVKEQKQIAAALQAGSIDIVIGTHRLISKDIRFRDLGLLIIDEEHRFGVTTKEKLRQIKTSVDTLSLTATPIPRTLHLSLIGARDLSLITTPPRNRLPILTEIIPADASGRQAHWRVIREAVLHEMHRGGQIYFVHDRVNNIEAIADQIRSHVPEARIHIAHGQMSGHELEKTMLAFLERKYDVLVCTKIIESGLDIPSVNTIIVNRTDRFGLAELYQLRGRVGRSNVQAYAYLLTPPLSSMPKQTLRRLQAIEEFTELGSGFNLAMRDLEIRGAGNLLGAEQSGFILEMGFEMYERILREAVGELKQEEFGMLLPAGTQEASANRKGPESVVESDIEALIPDIYVESDTERLDIYRRLYAASTSEDREGMQKELRDRFGEYPVEVEHLFALVELRHIAARGHFQKVTLYANTLTITLPDAGNTEFYGTPDDAHAPFQKLMKSIADGKTPPVQLRQEGSMLTLRHGLAGQEGIRQRLEGAGEILRALIAAMA